MLGMRSLCKNRILFVSMVALLGGVFGGACSDPDMPNNVVVVGEDVGFGVDSATTDISDSDTNDLDVVENDDVAPAADVSSDSGDSMDADLEVDAPRAYPRCGPVVNLGWLQPGKQTVSIDFSTLENHLATGCSNAKVDSKEAVFSFRLSDEGMMHLRSSSPVVGELRRSPCENDDFALLCREDGFLGKVAGAGVWFLVLEQLNDSAAVETVEVELELVPTPRCEDVGTARCIDENTIEKCDITETSPDILRLTRGVCAQGCVGNRCLGDSCESPIVVTERVEVEGDSALYFDTHDSRVGDSCHEEANDYHEPELVFELPELKAGNRVLVETVGDDAPHNILFKSSCEETSACLGYFEASSSMVWDVPSDGTYYVIVENGGWAPGDFEIVVEIKQD